MDSTQPQHTNRQYEEDLRGLRAGLLKMGGLVERQIAEAIDALVNRDSDHAREVIQRDEEVNRMDNDNDEQCIRLLALHQPTASDLRFITTGLKITTDLERIGDNAVNICERTLELNEVPRAHRRSRDQHRRDGHLHGQGQNDSPHGNQETGNRLNRLWGRRNESDKSGN